MNRRTFLSLSSAAAAAGMTRASSSATPRPDQPNVLVLLPDQWRAQSLGCFGNPDVQTPCLDRLAAEGIRLNHLFANSPVCGPARAILLTGRYASSNGVVANDLRLRENVPSVAEVFADHGYRTGYIGKWHLDGGPREPGFIPPGPRRHGFQFWAANECNHRPYGIHYFHDTPEPVETSAFEPDVWTDEALRFLDAPSGKPFFLMISTGAPHDPYIAPKKYRDRYDAGSLTMRSNWSSVKGGTRDDIANYYASITAVDEQVGRILAKLRERGLEENTIVLFASDHGNMLGSQGKLLKQKPWEESIRVPGILRYPSRFKGGQQSDTLVGHVDVAPTLLSMCGLPVPKTMQGADRSGAIASRSAPQPDGTIFQIFGPAGNEEGEGWRGLRTQTHMYARTKSAPWLLYDLVADPYELTNLIGDPRSAGIRQHLDDILARRMRQIGDAWQADWSTSLGDDLYQVKPFYSVGDYLAESRGKATSAPAR